MRVAVHSGPQWYEFDRQVDYGYPSHESLDPRPPFHQPLPATPPRAAKPGEFCGCPACLSGGWYPVSPACQFWRADCDRCNGTRRGGCRIAFWRRPGACCLCQQAWQAAVTWFYFTLRNPHAAAEALRGAVRHR